MGRKTNTFSRFSLIRRIAREMFVNGYRGYSEYMDASVNNRRYADQTALIKNCLSDNVLWPERGRGWITLDTVRIVGNPLNRLFKANKMSNTFQYALYFALLDMFYEGQELSLAEIANSLENDYQIEEFFHLQKSKILPHLREYVRYGILKKNKDGYYSLSGVVPSSNDRTGGLFDKFPALKDAISLLSESSPLGIIGSQIMDACDIHNSAFVFKHKHISQALDAIVISDLFHAISSHEVIEIRAEEKRREECFVALPLKILSSVIDGRQYAFVYDLNNNEYRFLRLDSIFGVVIQAISGKEFVAYTSGKTKDELIEDGLAKLNNVWASALYRYPLSQVNIDFEYDPVKEEHIRQRIVRERRNGHYSDGNQPGTMRYECDVYDPREMVPWLLSLTGYIKAIEITAGAKEARSRLINRFNDHMKKLGAIYVKGEGVVSYNRHPYQPVSEDLLKKWEESKNSSDIFSRFNSCYIQIYGTVLSRTNKPTERSEIQKYISEAIYNYGFEDTYLDVSFSEMLKIGMLHECYDQYGQLMMKEGKPLYESFLSHKDMPICRPLSHMERRWIRSIIEDQRLRLFLNDNEIQALRATLENDTPLYTPDEISIFDKYIDGDPYESATYVSSFRALLEVIQNGPAACRVSYTTEKSDEINTQILVPIKLEYSERDNKFRLLAHEVKEEEFIRGRRLVERKKGLSIIRLSNIVHVEPMAEDDILFASHEWNAIEQGLLCKEPIVVRVSNTFNAIERFMIAVSPYRKESKYDAETDTCIVRIWYATIDEKELLLTLRSFGGAIEVVGPKKVRAEIIKRVDKQYKLFEKSGYNLE